MAQEQLIVRAFSQSLVGKSQLGQSRLKLKRKRPPFGVQTEK